MTTPEATRSGSAATLRFGCEQYLSGVLGKGTKN